MHAGGSSRIEYYEFHFRPEFDSAAEDEFNSYKHEKGKRGLYIKCNEIADRERAGASYLQHRCAISKRNSRANS